MDLSKIDRKILDFACLNGAQVPVAKIARELRLKPSTVSYALKKMLRERAILGYKYRVNYARLGLGTIAWILLSVRSSKADPLKLLDQLLQFPQVHVASFITGDSDIALKVIERDFSAVDAFVVRITQQFSDVIEDTDVLLVTKNYKMHNIVPREFLPLPGFDETDLKILSSKMASPEKGLKEIAAGLGMHRNTVSKRWRMLWKQNVLLKKTPVLNPEHYRTMDVALKAIMLIEASPAACDSLAQRLAGLDEVHELNRVLGKFSLMALVRTADAMDFFDFIKKLIFDSANSGTIKKTASMVVLCSKPHSSNYLPALLKEGIIKFENGELVC